MTPGFGASWLEDVINGAASKPASRREARRLCDQQGHRYQVAGRMSPTKVVCKRCECSWAIGAKTEPTS